MVRTDPRAKRKKHIHPVHGTGWIFVRILGSGEGSPGISAVTVLSTRNAERPAGNTPKQASPGRAGCLVGGLSLDSYFFCQALTISCEVGVTVMTSVLASASAMRASASNSLTDRRIFSLLGARHRVLGTNTVQQSS